jgi:hypothetical protein
MNRTTPLVALMMLIGAACPCLASVGVERLRCEYLTNPLGNRIQYQTYDVTDLEDAAAIFDVGSGRYSFRSKVRR